MHGKRCVQCHKKGEEKCDGCDATCCEAHQYELKNKTKVCVQCFREKFGVAYSEEKERAVFTLFSLWIILSIPFASVATFFDYDVDSMTCHIYDVFSCYPLFVFVAGPFGIAMVIAESWHRGKNSLHGQYPQYDQNWSH